MSVMNESGSPASGTDPAPARIPIPEPTYEGDFASFWPYLKFGECVHVGHGATFGLGRYMVYEAL